MPRTAFVPVLVLVLVAGPSSVGLAGSTYVAPYTGAVTISTDSDGKPVGASGVVSAVRNSKVSEYISCQVSRSTTSPIPLLVFCTAQDSSGRFASCFSYDEKMADIASRINGDSLLSFAKAGSSFCSAIAITNSSTYEPKL